MASTAAMNGPDSVITIKIFWEGCTRRAKMVLRDMVPGTLEEQVRTFLNIPADHAVVIERYSDSAGAYIQLDRTNLSVYKQLYRAAKAKSKLKLRVRLQNEPSTAASPKPVSVEEVPEPTAITETPSAETVASPSPASQPSVPATQQPASTPSNPVEVTLPLRSGNISKTYDAHALSKAAQHISEFESMRRDLDQRLMAIQQRTRQHAQNTEAMMEEAEAQRRRCEDEVANGLRNPFAAASSAAPPPPFAPRGMLPVTRRPVVNGARAGACTRNEPSAFAVCCNSCDKTMPDVHFHCSTCDDGDFDLCSSCVEQGITCHSPDHWMIKRTTVDGKIVNSTTHVVQTAKILPEVNSILDLSQKLNATFKGTKTPSAPCAVLRTCNSCVSELPESAFLHCKECEDFDLCQPCFAKNAHGHHPVHAFEPAVPGTQMPESIKIKMAPGRNQMHHAICDGCDKYITGVRHKCLDCPDWDHCSTCQPNAHIVHPGHRFVPIYAPLTDAPRTLARSVHMGICCDGPLCANSKGFPSYIRGIRYKCAVCDDVDFCANCEANPNTEHNKTHPLIMFKTPIRNVSITTMGEEPNGQQMPPMGDRPRYPSVPTRAAKVAAPKVEKTEIKKELVPIVAEYVKDTVETVSKPVVKVEPTIQESREKDLLATFVRDTVTDGTIMAPNHVFEQTWVLRNDGPVAWPAGCSVKFVGGDYMGHVDSNHPAEISKLVSASESTICYDALAPGQEFTFNVLLRTPSRPGKFVSYWRLSSSSGFKFGHRLWCDVNVRVVKTEEPKPAPKIESPAVVQTPEVEVPAVEEAEESSVSSSRMIFPKLEKESPMASMHEPSRAPSTIVDDKASSAGVPDMSADDEEWDVSEDGFLTDEEYDILDASDEELLEEHAKKQMK